MKRIQTNIAGFPFFLAVPSTIEEHQSAHGGKEGITLKKAIEYDVAHTVLGKYRTKLVGQLVELGAKKDIVSGEGTENVVYGKTDQKWITKSIKDLGLSAQDVSGVLQKIADDVGYDVSGSGGDSDFTQVDLRNAKQMLNAIAAGETSFATVKSKVEKANPGVIVEVDENTGEFTAEQLAPALKAHRVRIAAEAQASLL